MIYYIDLFCGAGGVTTGIVRAKAKVIACINHDPLAIQSHKANHRDVVHFTEDIRHFNVNILGGMVRDIRKKDPQAVICLWASLECTHFSKAKGGGPRDADSRTLAEHLYRYIAEINPDYIDIENVTEFMSWGPLRIACEAMHPDRCDLKLAGGKATPWQTHPYHMIPENKKKGKLYYDWYQHICDQYNYEYDHRILNSADFGARTSRVRYFGQFKKRHLPFTWPEQTHAKKPVNGGIGKKMKKWRAVRPALNLKDKGNSIFIGKMRSENTLKRLYAGLIKHVGDGKEPEFITKWMSGNMKNIDLNDPCVTITTMNHLGLVSPEFISKYMSNPRGGVSNPVDPNGPAPTVTTHGRLALVQPEPINALIRGLNTNSENPAKVFLSKYYGTGITHDIEKPADTLTTKDRMAIVWIDKQYSGPTNHQGIDRPSGSILSNDKHCKVEAVLVSDFVNDESNSDEYFLYNPQFDSKGAPIEKPCFTLIARMDKAPPSLVGVDRVEVNGTAVIIYKDDPEVLKKIKMFMAIHGIADIKMRMLRVKELLRIQGFGASYKLAGNQAHQKKFIGNSVPPELVAQMVNARHQRLRDVGEAQMVA